MSGERVVLIARADDFGVTPGANAAILEAARAGLVRNIGVLAVGPYVEEGVEGLRALAGRVCVGLHAAINCEWEGLRWGPAAPAGEVAGLAGEDGCFLRSPMENHGRSGVREIMREVEAQWERLAGLGLRAGYVDTHMGFHWLPGVREALEGFCRERGVVFGDGEGFPKLDLPWEGPLGITNGAELAAAARGAGRRVVVGVFHPAWERGLEARVFGAGTAARREAETRLLTRPGLAEELRRAGVVCGRFDEAAAERG